MKIEAVEFFYLSMPEVTEEADGSQDALLVRVAAGGHVGWGECEAAPLPSIAAFVCPMSHGVCHPVGHSVLGRTLDKVRDHARDADALEDDDAMLPGQPGGQLQFVRCAGVHGMCGAKGFRQCTGTRCRGACSTCTRWSRIMMVFIVFTCAASRSGSLATASRRTP